MERGAYLSEMSWYQRALLLKNSKLLKKKKKKRILVGLPDTQKRLESRWLQLSLSAESIAPFSPLGFLCCGAPGVYKLTFYDLIVLLCDTGVFPSLGLNGLFTWTLGWKQRISKLVDVLGTEYNLTPHACPRLHFMRPAGYSFFTIVNTRFTRQ